MIEVSRLWAKLIYLLFIYYTVYNGLSTYVEVYADDIVLIELQFEED